jgi:hypothetical protein
MNFFFPIVHTTIPNKYAFSFHLILPSSILLCGLFYDDVSTL